ncbi:BnaA10g09550D [Brassica napus]|uniref:BnaA10g09550D protein n=1 Tax=Brassica napus TaxID=3708 RepID=A0A078FWJ1_BRANA|nr:BnaA10g09550D [Brassica napus]
MSKRSPCNLKINLQIQISHCDFTSLSATTRRLRSRGRSYLLTSPGHRRRTISPLVPAKATSGTDSPGELSSSNREFCKERSWFRCFYSETLQSSICEGRNLRMVPDRIAMTRGGEKLEEVMGRNAEEEEFQEGARETAKRGAVSRRLVNEEMLNEEIQEGGIDSHTMRDLVASIRVVGTEDFVCEEWVEEPTLLDTRFEYANMFHTVTDWYSAYVSSRVTGLPNRPHVVFIDGHCTTQLEETWTALFSAIRYAKNFSKPVCFRHAVLSPLGYKTALVKGLSEEIDCKGESVQSLWQNPNVKKTARLSEFGEMIRSAFRFPVNRHRSSETSSSSSPLHNVLFVRREDYLAHPRRGGKVQFRLINEEEVFESLHHWVASGSTGLKKCGINLVNGLFAHMSMKNQVKAIQDASVIIGAHGAGLTHIVSATPNTRIFEIVNLEFQRPHFELIAKWKGLEYHAMHLANSRADPTAVIEKLKKIMKSFGC